MELPQLTRDRGCRACPLGETARTVCIPTRAYSQAGRSVAVLLVGKMPGVEEEAQDAHFVGEAGKIATNVYVKYRDLPSKADIYLTNAVRCRPPGESTPSVGMVGKCTEAHLNRDIDALTAAYERVVILACGAEAARATTGTSLTDAFHKQGHQYRGATCIFTYNPFLLKRDLDPALVHAVQDHLTLLHKLVDTGRLVDQTGTLETPRALLPPTTPVLSIDIESYGAVITQPEQTCFHPQKSLAVDKVEPSELIQTIALAWEAPDGIGHSIYVWPDDRDILLQAFARHSGVFLFMNTVFDMTYLRAADLTLREQLSWPRFRRHQALLDDLAIVNHQHSNVRPERSLKNLSLIRGVADYAAEGLGLRGGHRYPSKYDPKLWEYNCLDAVSTLRLYRDLEGAIQRDYPGTNKRTLYTRRFWSRLLWSVIHMTENGVEYDRDSLSDIDTHCARTCDDIRQRYEMTVPQPPSPKKKKSRPDKIISTIAGEGSQAPMKERFVQMVAQAGVEMDQRLARTDKTKEISTADENIQLLLANLPTTSPHYAYLTDLAQYRESEKLRSTYAGPLLRGNTRHGMAAALVGSRAYPQWYPVPMHAGRDNDEGGTAQGRLSAKLPPEQTPPPPIKACRRSRFLGGTLIEADYKNLEMYNCALQSGDPVMIAECVAHIDFHRENAGLLFGPEIYADESGHHYKTCRQATKSFNFGYLIYRGGAKTIAEMIRIKVGLELPVRDVDEKGKRLRRKYHRTDEWQLRELLPAVMRTGILLMEPLLGDTRLLVRGSMAEAAYMNVVANAPVQNQSARIVQDAHAELICERDDRNLRTVFCAQTHDSILADCPPDEVAIVREMMERIMPNPPHYQALCQHYGRSVPLLVDFKSKQNPPTI